MEKVISMNEKKDEKEETKRPHFVLQPKDLYTTLSGKVLSPSERQPTLHELFVIRKTGDN